MNTPAPEPIQDEEEKKTYKINNILDEKNQKIILSCLITSNVFPFYYEVSLGFEDFKNINKNLLVCEDIYGINSFIIENIKENKIIVEEMEQSEKIKLIFTIFNIKGKPETFNIVLEKKQKNSNEITNELINNLNYLIKENSQLNFKLKKTEDELIYIKNVLDYNINSLITKNKQEQSFLEKRINQIPYFMNKKYVYNLLYRASIDGDSSITFHKLCNNKNNLLFLIKTTKKLRFGGFMTKPILEKDYKKCISDDDAFCFSLTLNKIYNKIKKYGMSIYLDEYEIITFLSDIFKIRDKFYENQKGDKCICNDGDRQMFFDNQGYKYEINGGKKDFCIKELEVFEIICI